MRRTVISVAAAVLAFGAVLTALFLPRVLVTNGSEIAHGLALPPGPPNTSVHAAPLPAPAQAGQAKPAPATAAAARRHRSAPDLRARPELLGLAQRRARGAVFG